MDEFLIIRIIWLIVAAGEAVEAVAQAVSGNWPVVGILAAGLAAIAVLWRTLVRPDMEAVARQEHEHQARCGVPASPSWRRSWRSVPERRVHDYRKPYWGHNTIITPDPDPTTASVTGWGDGVRQHDLLLLPNGESACFYVIETIRRPGNPPDMWTAHCRWVHAESRLGLKATLALDKQAVFAPSGLTSWRVFND